VTPVLLLLAVLVAAAGVVAVAAPDPRHAALAAFAAILLAAFVADPLPSPAALLARTAGAALGGWLTWLAVDAAPRASDRSALGWPGAAAAATVAFVAGWLASASLATTLGFEAADGRVSGVAGAALAAGSPVPSAAVGAACALFVLAASPVFQPRDGLRVGLGTILLLAAAGLLCGGLGAGPDDTVELAFAAVAALTGAGIAAVVRAMLRSPGDLHLRDPLARESTVRHRPADEAHRRPAP
jgi:hypothetical protein